MISFPNAKINIGLYVTEKRNDGYHNLESIFYPIEWNDILEITESNTTSFKSTGIPIPGESSDNLCLKAFRLLETDFKIPPVAIHLHKIIPIGAGLGGGSADASFTLQTLNELFGLNISSDNLKNYARQLGSDCAFFIDNEPVLALEKGDVFKPCALSLKDLWVILINPGIHISTQEAYANIMLDKPQMDLSSLTSSSIDTWKNTLHNSFEFTVSNAYPIVNTLKENLYAVGASYCSMTGSGSTIYGIFEKEPDHLPLKEDGMTVKKIQLK